MSNYIKFVGRFSLLKSLGFTYHLLYDNKVFYNGADIWIQKANGSSVCFSGYETEMSLAILNYLVAHNFELDDDIFLRYNMNTKEIAPTDYEKLFANYETMEQINEAGLENVIASLKYVTNTREVNVKSETVETLKKLYEQGMLLEQTF